MKIYVAGPMSGIKNLNATAFNTATKRLRKAGYTVVNPQEEDAKKYGTKVPKTFAGSPMWQDCLKRDIKDIITCDAIHLLTGWERSKGATFEYMVAKELGLKVVDRNGLVMTPPNGSHESILVEAERLTNGPRRNTYGHPLDNFGRTASIWSGIFGREVTPEQVGLCMVGVKLARETNAHTRDNLVDLAGYSNTLAMIADKRREMKLEALHERADG